MLSIEILQVIKETYEEKMHYFANIYIYIYIHNSRSLTG